MKKNVFMVCLALLAVLASCNHDEPEVVKDDQFVFTVNGVSFSMVEVKGGTFMMGFPGEVDSDLNGFEKMICGQPAHEEAINDFFIGQTEVTQELWIAVMGENPSYFSSRNGYTDNLQRPVEYVSDRQCLEFIEKLNELTGCEFRLPTVAEWEYAARGGRYSGGYDFAGSNNIEDVAWHLYNSAYAEDERSADEGFSLSGPMTVASLAPNELGLYDMSGNVWEWCAGSFRMVLGETYRYIKGGSWNNEPKCCRTYYGSAMLSGKYNSWSNNVGLRLAL